MTGIEGLRWADPTDVTADALTDALHATGVLGAGQAVVGVESEAIGVGIGILSLLWRLTLRYQPEGSGPPTMVLKLPHTLAESRSISDAFRFYEREVRLYQEIADRTPIGTAECYLASFDQASGDFVLLIEDLGGRKVHDQITGCPPEDAERALRALAGHHAAWWEDPDVIAADWTFSIIDPPNPQALVPALRASWPVVESQFGHLLRGPMYEAAKRMPEASVALMASLSRAPQTLVHGDFRLDNIFFAGAPGHADVAVVDWQICGLGRAPYDVAYFLGQSLRSEDRRANEEALVRSYHDALSAGGVRGYDFAACWEDYRRATLFVSVYPLNAGSVDLVNARAVELFVTMLDRIVSAIIDLDALELMPTGP